MTDNTTTAAERAASLELAVKTVNSLGPFQPFDINSLLRDVLAAKTAGRVIHDAYEQQAAEIAELRAKLEVEKSEHLATQELHERSMRMIEAAIGPERDKHDGWRAEVSAKAITALRAAAQAFDDERPVDEEWLKANDFRHHNGLDAWMRDIANGNNIEVVISDHDGGVCAARDKPGYPVHIVQVVSGTPTITQLRHLLAALGGAK